MSPIYINFTNMFPLVGPTFTMRPALNPVKKIQDRCTERRREEAKLLAELTAGAVQLAEGARLVRQRSCP